MRLRSEPPVLREQNVAGFGTVSGAKESALAFSFANEQKSELAREITPFAVSPVKCIYVILNIASIYGIIDKALLNPDLCCKAVRLFSKDPGLGCVVPTRERSAKCVE